VGNPTELNISISDILDYEQNPLQGNWMKTIILWGGLMDAPNHPSYKPENTNAYKVQELMVKPNLQKMAWHMDIKTRYDYAQLQGNQYVYSADKLTNANAVSEFNLGASVLNYAGQAYYQGLALVHYDDPSGTKLIDESGSYSPLYYGSDGETATNTGKLPLFTSFTCGSADFAETRTYHDDTLERLLVSPDGGAIGLVGSTGKTYRGEAPKSDGNWWMAREFYEIFFNGTYQPGKTLTKMKENYITKILEKQYVDHQKYKAQLYGYHYQGDPELNIWTDLPKDIEVNATGLWLGQHNITVTVKDEFNVPITNARVCIQNDNLYVYGVTNSTGVAKIYANPTQLGEVELVVTGHNFLPYSNNYSLILEPPDLTIKTNNIEFSIDNPIVNQQITINATIMNRGQTDLASPVSIRITCDGISSAGGTQIGTDQVISGIGHGTSKIVSVTWNVLPGDHDINVQIDPENAVFESHKWNNIASKSIYIRKPELYIISEEIELSPTTDVYLGTNVLVSAKVHNSGDAPANNVKISFIDRSDTDPDKYIGTNKTITRVNVDSYESVSTWWPALGGEHEIIVTVDPDDQLPEFNEDNNSASKNITIKYPPTISPIPDIELDEDPPSKPNATRLPLYIRDKDTNTFDLNITVSSSDKNCSITLNKNLGLDLTVIPDWFGNATVLITASDGVVTVNQSFKIIVNPMPDAPRFNETDYILEAAEDQEFIHIIKAYDLENDEIAFSDDIDLFDINETTGQIRFTPNQDHVNNSPYMFNITISDGVLSTQQEFTLNVINVPDAPIILQVEDQFATEDKAFKLQIIAMDVDSPLLFYYSNQNTLFVIDLETGEISFKPRVGHAGTYDVSITVSDSDTHLSSIMTFKLTINESGYQPPVDGQDGEDGNGTPDGDDESEIFLGEVAGIPVILFVVLIIIIIVILIVMLIVLKKRRNKTDQSQFFHAEYSDSTDTSNNQSPRSDEKLSYEDEYSQLYGATPPEKSTSSKTKKTKPIEKSSKSKHISAKKRTGKGKSKSEQNTGGPVPVRKKVVGKTKK